jgi:tetratricopeptide (TPR) repeat protein/tRNA A-37 threonylcarbamoyl transferase component Bud32
MAVQWVGPYRIVEALGKGAMGEVYLADDPRLRRRVALKRLSDPDLRSPESRRRLLREARAAARLNHPNVASVYDIVESDDGVHIVMEYVAGETLAARLRSGRLAPPTAVSIAIQLAEALAEAHAMGVIHRDLKPGNVVVTAGDRVKVLDFGLARTRGIAGRDPAWSGSHSSDTGDDADGIAGTPPYMAPETFLGRAPDARADMYSLGITLFEMLTGRRPFAGDDLATVRTAVLSNPTPRIRDVDPALPAGLDAVVARAMARNSDERYGSAAELAEALRGEFMDAPTMSGRRWTALVAGPRARRRWVIALAAVALIAALTPLIPRPPRAPASPGSAVVAVLPLTNTTGDPANDRLGIGIADVLTSTLARVPGVTMISRSATLAYQKPDRDVPSIARELGADLIVDGAVQASHDTVRVTLNLLRPRTNVVAWSRAYDGAFSEIFALQTEAATALSEALQVTLTPEDKRKLRPATTNVEALADYAQARQFLERSDVKGNVDRSVGLFRSALERDPRYAAAHAGLGQAYWFQFQQTRDTAFSDKALLEITESLRLDPDDSAAHHALAIVYAGKGRKDQAMEELHRAIALQPGNDDAHKVLGRLLFEEGRRDEGLAEIRKAVELRPNFWGNHYSLGTSYYEAGRYPEAAAAFRRVTQLQPDSTRGFLMLATTYYAAGDADQAIATFKQAIAIAPDTAVYTNLGTVLYSEKRFAEAAVAFEEAARLSPNAPIKQRNLGDAYRHLGEPAKAQRAYSRAVELCEKDIQSNPRDARTLSMLGVYLAKLGRMADAQRRADEAVSLGPKMPDVVYRRAVVLTLAGHSGDGSRALEDALRLGYSASAARTDEDLTALHSRSDFNSLVGESAPIVAKGESK